MLKRLLFAVLMLCAFAAEAVVYSSPFGPKPQFVDANGSPMSGGTLSTYLATTTTPQLTYTDSTGGSSNPTTITLNVRGETPNELWFAAGVSYKLVLKDSSGSTVWTIDNIAGVNDVTAQLSSEWVASGLTPTFVSGTSFTLTGDQTTNFHVGRRLKSTNTAGTIYSTITASSFAVSTTVTVANDSGTLDSGLSAVSYGMLASNSPSLPWLKSSVAMAGTLTPSQITGNQNDYSPSGLGTANVLRISTDARRNITGLAGGFTGRVLHLQNVGTFPAVLKYEDTGSTSTNRFSFGYTLGGGQSIYLIYDTVASRWRAQSLPIEIGTLKDFAGSTVPEGWLACDGSAVSRTTYAALFNEIGTTWGIGDGSTTFNVPDFRGRGAVGSGTGTVAETVAAASVNTGADTFTVSSNNTKWITGQKVQLTTTNTLPAGLSLATDYWIIRASATTIQFATTLANAQNGVQIDITTQGTGNHTVTGTLTARTLAEIGGEESHAMTNTELLSHSHGVTVDTSTTTAGSVVRSGLNSDSSRNTGTAGGNAAMNVMQPFGVVTKVIKF